MPGARNDWRRTDMTLDQYRVIRSCIAGRIAEIKSMIERGALQGVRTEYWQQSMQQHEACLAALAEDYKRYEGIRQ